MRSEDAVALHLWRTAHRETQLHFLLIWAMTETMNLALAEALDVKPKALTAAANFDGLTAEEIADRLAAAYTRSGADDFWNQFTSTTMVEQLRQNTIDATGDVLYDAGIVPRINFELFDEQTATHIAEAPNRIRNNPQELWESFLQPELIDGARAGESIPALADRVRLAVPETYSGRARTIARTEVISATNAAQYATGSRFGLGTAVWLATNDERTRQTHRDVNGTSPNDDGVWVFPDGSALKYPGDPAGSAAEVINCRCTTIYPQTLNDQDGTPEDTFRAPDEVDRWVGSRFAENESLVQAMLRGATAGGFGLPRPVVDAEGAVLPRGVSTLDPARLWSAFQWYRMADGDPPGPRQPDIRESMLTAMPEVEVPVLTRSERNSRIERWLANRPTTSIAVATGLDVDHTRPLTADTELAAELAEDGLDLYLEEWGPVNDLLRAADYAGPLSPLLFDFQDEDDDSLTAAATDLDDPDTAVRVFDWWLTHSDSDAVHTVNDPVTVWMSGDATDLFGDDDPAGFLGDRIEDPSFLSVSYRHIPTARHAAKAARPLMFEIVLSPGVRFVEGAAGSGELVVAARTVLAITGIEVSEGDDGEAVRVSAVALSPEQAELFPHPPEDDEDEVEG